ncbi:SMC family ATPase [Amycolatopsis balhimycina DSM 5908]|uniref:Nuclease SbcCD subunit C n=1 Tax=Amycolatopsis balhimycina DSM 5908 TaxID=1081091 RepID=A0A428WCS6_AMYBA|nr:SMC family ATPase [Amycolatopsis balhimycina]RSM40874.1 SMC family ATPase [Amycolatopsis balhimycina DSM 5908]
MRPVLLEMTGFASFREKTEVSFEETDYFALVGPTGAGKSTVIDALTFALYGSVARWDHEGLVAPALAPTTNRATVRLVFDAGGARYHVVREVRRGGGKKPTVSVKNVRLERLADPTAPGGPEDDAEAVAADSEVTPAVERLLGLTFKHFCTCVALPQGDFAEFLHAKAADRQKILIKLLGLEVYERVGRRAGVTAEQQKQRAAVLTEQLGSYADATGKAVEELAARMTALADLDARVNAALPGLNDAIRAHDDARQRFATLTKELSVLDALERPDGVEDLETRRRAAADAATAARAGREKAETADETARAALAAAPGRAELERIRSARAELVEIEKALPGLEEAAKTASAEKAAAAAAVTEAVSVAETARATRDKTARAAEEATAEAARARQDRDRLAGLRPPSDLGDLTAEAARVAKRTADAAARLSAAEAADAEARAALAAQPDVAPLAAARSDARTLYALCEAQRKAAPEQAAHRKEVEAARSAFARADAEVTAAKTAVTEAERAGQALSLRAGLAVGHPCPVCEQEVPALPDAGGHAHLAEARERLDRAERDRAGAESALRKLERAVDRDADSAASAAAQAEELRAVLAEVDGPPESAVLRRPVEASFSEQDYAELVTAVRERGEWLSATIDGRTRVAETANAADKELAAVRAERVAAQHEADVVEKSFAAAREALRAARDPLVELGAPAIDGDDVPAGWQRLTAWAASALEKWRTTLAALEAAAEAAGKEAVVAADDLAAAERNAEQRRARAVDAGLAEQSADTTLTTSRRRHGELATVLADAPSADVVAGQLAEVASLEEAAKKADADLRTARAAAKQAVEAQERMTEQVDAERQKLFRARDPLVGLGAPPIDGESLLGAWAALTDWAAAQANTHRESLAVAKTAESEAAEALLAAERAVADDVTALEVPLEPGPVRDRVPVAVATARARAEADHTEMKRRVARVAGLRGDIAAAESEAQVARLLADLLRSDKFPRWLIAGALDTLVAEASASLLELSGGQFELTHDKGDFLVVDHNEADARRPVKTLSGGETFQASLALALALSSQLGAMAAEGATRLESIFLDEGFGTLDEATLDVVASTLENLAATGSRMVGVITHVPALAERVPVRFLVTRDGTGSHIAREGA